MKRWLKSLFKPDKPVSVPAPPPPEQLRAWELSKAEWVREQRERMPINRLITIPRIPVQVKMELSAQGVSTIQELVQRWDELAIPTPYRAMIGTWLDELQQSLQEQYAELVAVKPR